MTYAAGLLKVSEYVNLQINAATNIPGAADGSAPTNGYLLLNGGKLTPLSAVTIARPVTIGAASTIDTTTAALTISGAVTYTAGLTVSGDDVLTLSAENSGNGGITTAGTRTLKLTHASGAGTGAITLGNGTGLETAISGDAGVITNAIALGSSGQTATITAINSGTLSGVISGAADLTITGTAKTLILSGTNTNNGKTILGGTATLSVAERDNLGSTSSITMGDGTTLFVTTGGWSLPPLVL